MRARSGSSRSSLASSVPGGLLLISDYPLQHDARNRSRYEAFRDEFGVHGTFRLSDGAVVRHHSIDWFMELLADLSIEERIELDAKTMNGNPARIVQFWATNGSGPAATDDDDGRARPRPS